MNHTSHLWHNNYCTSCDVVKGMEGADSECPSPVAPAFETGEQQPISEIAELLIQGAQHSQMMREANDLANADYQARRAAECFDSAVTLLLNRRAEQRVEVEGRACGQCGGRMVEIRGRHPRTPRRIVCPTCLADRLTFIHETSDPNYGKAYQAEAPSLSANRLGDGQ